MQDRFVLDFAQTFVPFEAAAQVTGLALVVLRTDRIWMQLQVTLVHLDAGAVGRPTVGEAPGGMYHPFQRDVGEPRFVFRIASSDVGVISGEPHLLQPVPIFIGAFRPLVVRSAPRDAREVGAFSSIDMAWRAYQTALFRCRS
jgi:hypothetical protein